MSFNNETTLKEIAASSPAAARVLEEAGVDYCCGGNHSLENGCAGTGVAAEEILARLHASAGQTSPEDADWRSAPLAELTNHIRQKHHAYVREAIPRVFALLEKVKASGRILSLKIEEPANHMTEDARWDYRVTIRYKNSTLATTSNPDEERLMKQLWPDQATYQREEQRRFEILLAHWDLPVTDITPAGQ